jgi:hypothetical protein
MNQMSLLTHQPAMHNQTCKWLLPKPTIANEQVLAVQQQLLWRSPNTYRLSPSSVTAGCELNM